MHNLEALRPDGGTTVVSLSFEDARKVRSALEHGVGLTVRLGALGLGQIL